MKLHWFRVTPDRVLIGLLIADGALWISESARWLPKGWPVLVAIVCTAAVVACLLLWWGVAAIFRWRFQFGIRSLLMLVLAIAVPAGWLAAERDAAVRQSATVAALSKEGGTRYSYLFDDDGREIVNRRVVPAPSTTTRATAPNGVIVAIATGVPTVTFSYGEPPGPSWLRNLLGLDFFTDVFYATVRTDAELEHVGGLSELRVLTHSSGFVPLLTDAGVKHIGGLRRLHKLDLSETNVTDAGLVYLRDLSQLRDLSLRATRITDAGLAQLTELENLEFLSIGLTRVTGQGIAQLRQRLPNCKVSVQ